MNYLICGLLEVIFCPKRSQFVEEFAEGLEKMALKDLPVATFLLPLTEAHLSRHLNAQLVGKVEEKVHRLTTPLQTTASSNAAS